MPPYCPEHDTHHTYYAQCIEMRRAAFVAQKDAERRARAEQIADAHLRAYNDEHGMTLAADAGNFSLPARVRSMMLAAIMQALAEKETDR